MLEFIPLILALFLIAITLVRGFCHLRPLLIPTTLRGAGDWLLLASLFWILVSTALMIPDFLSDRVLSRVHYVSTILMLTPLVAVLGAKRPGVRVWNVFVVIPMLGMLNWPLIAEFFGSVGNEQLTLEPPALLGAGVVLLMVLGNYFGTIFTASALLYCFGIAISLTSISESLPQLSSSLPIVRGLGGMCLGIALLRGVRRYQREESSRTGYERVWLDFRDWFGILWTRRVMERLNQTAEQENWGCRLFLDGIVWQLDPGEEQKRSTLAKMDHAFRWILRRFVDEEWIDRRLNESPNTH